MIQMLKKDNLINHTIKLIIFLFIVGVFNYKIISMENVLNFNIINFNNETNLKFDSLKTYDIDNDFDKRLDCNQPISYYIDSLLPTNSINIKPKFIIHNKTTLKIKCDSKIIVEKDVHNTKLKSIFNEIKNLRTLQKDINELRRKHNEYHRKYNKEIKNNTKKWVLFQQKKKKYNENYIKNIKNNPEKLESLKFNNKQRQIKYKKKMKENAEQWKLFKKK